MKSEMMPPGTGALYCTLKTTNRLNILKRVWYFNHIQLLVIITLNIFANYVTTSAFMIDNIDNKVTRPIKRIPKSYDKSDQISKSAFGQRKPIISTVVSLSRDTSNGMDEGKDETERRKSNTSKSDKDESEMDVQNMDRKDEKNVLERGVDNDKKYEELLAQNGNLKNRVIQLEALAGSQAVEIRKLREEYKSIKETADAFAQVVDLLRQAGLSMDQQSTRSKPNTDMDESPASTKKELNKPVEKEVNQKEYKYADESEIFGSAPASVTDAADAAGASILAALLGGKQRMLVDVRDAELTRDPDVLVQFIELAILPVAAGLEGLKTQKNRVKIIFPTVSQLMQYRKTMALAAPEVVSLSTLGFDPVEKRDNLVVIIAPSPDDEEGLLQMNELLSNSSVKQPIVVLNHHMVPLAGPGGEYEPIYHLRLLTVQYMAGGTSFNNPDKRGQDHDLIPGTDDSGSNKQIPLKSNSTGNAITNSTAPSRSFEKEDAALAAAMEHAHELGVHQGVTRAMVIRAYPRPWHIFVDTSPDTDADFEVAATFDEYPSQEDINYAIVECLEGSEREDELVAQQMQEAIESGQLNSISDMLGLANVDKEIGPDDEDDEDDFYNDWDPWFGTDTV